jgi:hypothetical protein
MVWSLRCSIAKTVGGAMAARMQAVEGSKGQRGYHQINNQESRIKNQESRFKIQELRINNQQSTINKN